MKTKIIATKVIEGTLIGFNSDIEEALAEGWELFGELHVSLISPNEYSRIDYSQQVVLWGSSSPS